jgi:phage terminase small subunit
MEGSGRRSTASLTVAAASPWARLSPPEWLTEDAKTLWRDVVETKPPEWFKADAAPLLEAYCKTVVEYRRASLALDSIQPADVADYKKLSDVTTSLAMRMGDLATKMRLTQQSRYTPAVATTADKKTASAKPWEIRA